MAELRALLAETIPQQSRFLVRRLEAALPRLLQGAPEEEHEALSGRFQRLAATPAGRYALVDYVNFKGEGVEPTERYQGYGWGLLQVLEVMQDGDDLTPADAFADAAMTVLLRRVRNAPTERGEARWLAGWSRRIETYRP